MPSRTLQRRGKRVRLSHRNRRHARPTLETLEDRSLPSSSPGGSLVLSGYTTTTAAGAPMPFILTARDAVDGVAAAFKDRVHFASTDPKAVLPADYTFTTGPGRDNGTHTFVVTFTTPGTTSLTVTDPVQGITVTVSAISVNKYLSAPMMVTAGTGPVGLAVGDFNKDGSRDLAVTNVLDNTVSVLLGNGDGSFQAAVNYPGGDVPLAIVTGDLNGDGKTDLIVADAGNLAANSGGYLSVYLGRGNGAFDFGGNFSVGVNPSALAIGDFNRDGKLDVAAANHGTNNVTVLLGKGDGTLMPAPGASPHVGTHPSSIIAADFNGDGKLDLATANNDSNSVSILLGKGDGTFQTPVNVPAGADAGWVASADFNGDGKRDLAVVNRSGIEVLLGIGNGGFNAGTEYAFPNDDALAIGDLTGDRKLDLVATSSRDGAVGVFPGNGDGTFQSGVFYPAAAGALMPVVADFDGNATPDVAVTAFQGNDVALLFNPGNTQVQFGASNYVASEGGTATITVTRTGNTNAAVTVNYATADGSAVAGADYTAANGTLTFAAGETSKTFTVSLQSDALVEAKRTVLLALSDPSGATVPGGAARAMLTIRDGDGAANQRYVAQLYSDLLGRAVDASGLTYWGGLLNAGVPRAAVVQALMTTSEFRQARVRQAYQELLGRAADPVGLNLFANFLNAGGAIEQMKAILLSSPEYLQRAGGTTAGFLSALYRDVLGRDIDLTSALVWRMQLDAGMTNRFAAALLLLNTAEGQQHTVQDLYFRELGRPAEAAAVDYFVFALKHGIRDEQILGVLVGSQEYANAV
jgi:hypothetical protein